MEEDAEEVAEVEAAAEEGGQGGRGRIGGGRRGRSWWRNKGGEKIVVVACMAWREGPDTHSMTQTSTLCSAATATSVMKIRRRSEAPAARADIRRRSEAPAARADTRRRSEAPAARAEKSLQ